MASTNSDAVGTKAADGIIEALLERRAQYEQWLARLEATGEKAPATVRERVRADYEARLRGVIDELRGHATTIRQELEQHRATQSRLSADRRHAEETLAEAEVRYAVGEYADEEWQRLSGESQQHLDQLRGELEAVGQEIARLAEVQAVIDGASPRPVEAAAPVAPEPVPSPAPVAVDPAPVEERVPVEPVRAPALDELAFLKSVSDDDHRPAAAPTPRRSSGPPAAAPKQVEAMPAPAATSAPTGAAAKTAGMAKTLKCNECGTLNRPTEWYCERCGAELAAL